METRISPAAEYVLDNAINRAMDFVRDGRIEDAERALTLGADTANLIDVAERARIVGRET